MEYTERIIQHDIKLLKLDRKLLINRIYHLKVRKQVCEAQGLYTYIKYYNHKINKVTKEINKIEFKMSTLATLLPKIDHERIKIKQLM